MLLPLLSRGGGGKLHAVSDDPDSWWFKMTIVLRCS